jgi:hypothetical protein
MHEPRLAGWGDHRTTTLSPLRTYHTPGALEWERKIDAPPGYD